MKVIGTREKVIKTSTTVYEILEGVALLVNKKNGRPIDYSIHQMEDIEFGKTIVKVASGAKSYKYYSDEFLQKLQKDNFMELWQTCKPMSAIEVLNQKEYKKENILYFDIASHLFYQIDKDEPLSGIYLFNHCKGSLTNLEYDLKGLKDHLDNCPEILNAEIHDIPFYNREFTNHKELVLRVRLSQETFDKLWNKVKGEEFPSVRIQDEILGKYEKTTDLFGIRRFRKSDEEIEMKMEISNNW